MQFFQLKEFQSYGCSDEAQVSTACFLYIELCEGISFVSKNEFKFKFHNFYLFLFLVRRKHYVNHYYNEAMNLIYLISSGVNNDINEIYLPQPATVEINLIKLEIIRNAIIDEHHNKWTDLNTINFNLAIVDPNTTIIYYKLEKGLVDINDASKQSKKNHSLNTQFVG